MTSFKWRISTISLAHLPADTIQFKSCKCKLPQSQLHWVWLSYVCHSQRLLRLITTSCKVCTTSHVCCSWYSTTQTVVGVTCEGTHKTFSCITGCLFYNYRYILCTHPIVSDCACIKPANGSIKFSSSLLQPGTTATYSCNKGFLLTGGDSVRTCQQDGTYTGNAPSCVGEFTVLYPLSSEAAICSCKMLFATKSIKRTSSTKWSHSGEPSHIQV